jgi:hypothetical protein
MEVRFVASHEHAEPLSLLREYMRDSNKPVPPSFSKQLQRFIERGGLEVFAARTEERLLGVALLTFRANASADSLFVSIENLYVRPYTRRRGVGQALLEAMGSGARRAASPTSGFRPMMTQWSSSLYLATKLSPERDCSHVPILFRSQRSALLVLMTADTA